MNIGDDMLYFSVIILIVTKRHRSSILYTHRFACAHPTVTQVEKSIFGMKLEK